MQYRLPTPRQSHFAILPAVSAAALAAAIFAVDSITHPEIAVAPLYAAVVLLVVKVLDTRGVLSVAAGCILLSIAGAAMHDHEELSLVALVNLFSSLAAISVTTYLALRNQSADRALLEQAHLLDVVHDGIIVRNMDDVVALLEPRRGAFVWLDPRSSRGQGLAPVVANGFPSTLRGAKGRHASHRTVGGGGSPYSARRNTAYLGQPLVPSARPPRQPRGND